MGHKAGREFFLRKRPWSERKDRILTDYLPAYTQKVAHALGRPVCVVDGFAGPGRFHDGSPGSPEIIREVMTAAAKRKGVVVRAILIEKDPDLCAELRARMADVEWIEVREGTFLESIPTLEQVATTHTVFLYLDPYAVEGLAWDALDRVLRGLEQGRSIEILLNFNADSFARRGLAALRLHDVIPDADPDDPDSVGPGTAETPILDLLDSIVGGGWWRAVLQRDRPYPERVQGIVDGFCDRLRSRFARVCVQQIRGRVGDRVPKYALVFGTRSREALLLMNDAMVGSREMLAESSAPPEGTLFETRPEEVVPAWDRLTAFVLEAATRRQARIALIEGVVRRAIGSWRRTEIRAEIERLLRTKRLVSASGRWRVNDEESVWRSDALG